MLVYLRQISFVVKGSRIISTSPVIKQPYTPTDNPGVYRRLKAIKKHEADVIEKSSIDLESLDDMEENLWNANQLHDEIRGDMKKIKRKHEFKMTERKYFRPPKEPSMLTWAEREQIKFLNQSNPEKWTPEALADSFPASPTIIKKILQSNWKPFTADRLKVYDETVSKNWIAFHRGHLEVHDPHLRHHLQKFTDRKNGVQTISDEDAKKAAEIILPKPKKTEFLSLITSFNLKTKEKADPDSKLVEDKEQILKRKQQIESKKLSTTHLTLEQLSNKLKSTDNIPETPSDEGLMRINPRSKAADKDTQKDLPYIAPSERYQPDAYVTQRRHKSHLQLQSPNTLPDRIQIPKEKWKNGSTYRVVDSFYDDQGQFLYRVPGFTS